MKFPKLYKKTSTGKDQEWSIQTDGNVIITDWGQIGGMIQHSKELIAEGKNIGKANETTPAQQAEAEAKARWEKKLKGHGYTTSLDDARAGKASELVAGGILPMLAKKYSEDGDKIKFPCFTQRKYDGHRILAVVDGAGKCTLWSRTRKAINSLPHIIKDIESLKLKNVVLDGEGYNQAYKDKFEELTHFIRQSKPEAGCEIVQYHIYDVAMPGSFDIRTAYLEKILGPKGVGSLVRVETFEVGSEDELMVAFEGFLAEGCEGSMARNSDGLYVNKRSADLQKIKTFLDGEHICTAVEEGRGKLAGHAIFVLTANNGSEFRAKMKGETSELKKYFTNPELVIGRSITIQYQGLTAKGIPRFPVALRIREDV